MTFKSRNKKQFSLLVGHNFLADFETIDPLLLCETSSNLGCWGTIMVFLLAHCLIVLSVSSDSCSFSQSLSTGIVTGSEFRLLCSTCINLLVDVIRFQVFHKLNHEESKIYIFSFNIFSFNIQILLLSLICVLSYRANPTFSHLDA